MKTQYLVVVGYQRTLSCTGIVTVYEGKNGFKRIYFDGKEVYSKETNTGLEENLTLQGLYIGDGAPYYTDNLFRRGLIAEFRVGDEALSAVKINAHKNKQRMGDERALSGYWKMDDGSGMVLRDSKAGNPRPATIHGAAWTVVNDLPVGPEYGLSA